MDKKAKKLFSGHNNLKYWIKLGLFNWEREILRPLHSGLESNWIRTEPTLMLSYAASTGPILSYAGSVSTLMARPDFLQYPAYHGLILPTPRY